MYATFEEIQNAFIDGRISINDLLEILVDNFGQAKANEIMISNIQIAMKKNEEKKITDDYFVTDLTPIGMCGPSFSFSNR